MPQNTSILVHGIQSDVLDGLSRRLSSFAKVRRSTTVEEFYGLLRLPNLRWIIVLDDAEWLNAFDQGFGNWPAILLRDDHDNPAYWGHFHERGISAVIRESDEDMLKVLLQNYVDHRWH